MLNSDCGLDDYLACPAVNSNWVQKVTFSEIVVVETTLTQLPNKINSIVEREIVIRDVSKEEFSDY